MKIIVPAAGLGDRFVQVGYGDPKPLIEVGGRKIIDYIIDMFNPDDEFVFIVNEKHWAETGIEEYLKERVKNCVVVKMPEHKLGPVFTVKAAFDYIQDDEEVIVSYCDNPLVWNYRNFLAYVHGYGMDGCILTHTGFHPHTLSNTKMAFLKTSGQFVVEVKEKESYTEVPQNEHASTGVYYFRRGGQLKSYFERAISEDLHYKGEYYVTLVYNLLIKSGLRIGYFDTSHVMVFGTPEEVEHFEAWKTLLSGKQIKNVEELVLSYNYWKDYHGAAPV